MGIPNITTERLHLRPFTLDDTSDLFAYASAPEFSQYVEYTSPQSLAEAQTFLEQVLLSNDPNQLSWAVCERNQPSVIGTVQMTRDTPNSVTVHYDISHLYYGRGYTTEAVRAMLQWCLAHVPEVTLFLGDTMASNIGSRRVLEKCGFTHYKTANVDWEKFDTPVELIFYKAERRDLESNFSHQTTSER